MFSTGIDDVILMSTDEAIPISALKDTIDSTRLVLCVTPPLLLIVALEYDMDKGAVLWVVIADTVDSIG